MIGGPEREEIDEGGFEWEPAEAQNDPRTYAIIGAAMEVHRQLGKGFLEPVYQEAMAVELAHRDIPFVAQQEMPIIYRGQQLKTFYKPDFLVYQEIIVEIKALTRLSGTEAAQIMNYLKASQLHVGLLLNFGTHSLFHRRLVRR